VAVTVSPAAGAAGDTARLTVIAIGEPSFEFRGQVFRAGGAGEEPAAVRISGTSAARIRGLEIGRD
jgi:hypothetical protein